MLLRGGDSELDDRISFAVAESVLAVVRDDSDKYGDSEAVWDSFVSWCGEDESEYLRGIRAGAKHIFYSVLQKLYDFGENECGRPVTGLVGRHLTDELMRRHMPDLLQASTVRSGTLAEQIVWLVKQFLPGATGEVYELEVSADPAGNLIRLLLSYRRQDDMVEHLKRRGHNPERSFAGSFSVIGGAFESLAEHAIHGFETRQMEMRLSGLQGTIELRLHDRNRFNYERMTEILLDYVGRLRQQATPGTDAVAVQEDSYGSPAMKSAWERIRKASASDETVLLSGESGTGKSYYARVIHQLSGRRDGAFVEVGLTCDVGSDNLVQSNLFGHVRGAFTGADKEKSGLFALAHGGTIFMDEIGDASPDLQAKLLRVLDGKSFKMLGGLADVKVDVRVIAATNKDLSEMVRDGEFREDLYYRLNVIQIEIPPLRRRTEDIELLVGRLFEKVRRDTGRLDKHLSEEALGVLCSLDWPGNIRQMENALRHAVVFSESARIEAQDLPNATLEAAPAGEPTEQCAGEDGRVIDRAALTRVLSLVPRPPGSQTYEWQGHVDYARREYLRALIERYNGNLSEITGHWDRSSERTLLKLVREFHLEDELRAARRRGK
jgi:DNA-binding NtrC family response regulator